MVAKARRVIKPIFRLVGVILRPLWRLLAIVFWPLRPVSRPVAGYLRGVRQEFRKVSWPSRKETWRLTASVVIFSVLFAAFVAIVDYGLTILFEKVIIRG